MPSGRTLLGGWGGTLRSLLARRHPAAVTLVERGTPRLVPGPDGAPRCVACALCAGACPADCIRVEAGPRTDEDDARHRDLVATRFDLDLGRCLLCGLCEAACPADAIRLDGRSAPAMAGTAEGLRLGLEELLEERA